MTAPVDAGTQPTDPPFAALHETHSGVVLLLGDRGYKAKKPIRTDFLDFTTRAARAVVCAREVELNRRLAPDVYLGVIELRDPDRPDDPGTGRPAGEPVVVMTRMPDRARLSTLVVGDDPGPVPVEHRVDEIADLVAGFHRTAQRGPDIDREGATDAVRRRWRANLDEVRAMPQEILTDERLAVLDRAVTRFLDGREALFADRVAQSRIVDGHGDLLTDDIFCLDDGPRVLDCLEFDDRLRYLDGLDDAACLAMDLEFLGRPDLATRFLDRYTGRTGDSAPDSLRHHYIAYRAFMRAKVDCVRHLQGRSAAADALRHTALAGEHLRRAAVRLALVGGLPATGKSTVAAALAETVGAHLLSSDRVRRELFADDRAAQPAPGYRRGRYAPGATDLVYTTLLDRARVLLDRGVSVVLDASWTDARLRRLAQHLAKETVADLIELRCVAPPELTELRLRARATGPGRDHDSEADPDIAQAMAAGADDWPDAAEVDTAGPLPGALHAAVRRWDSGADAVG